MSPPPELVTHEICLGSPNSCAKNLGEARYCGGFSGGGDLAISFSDGRLGNFWQSAMDSMWFMWRFKKERVEPELLRGSPLLYPPGYLAR